MNDDTITWERFDSAANGGRSLNTGIKNPIHTGIKRSADRDTGIKSPQRTGIK